MNCVVLNFVYNYDCFSTLLLIIIYLTIWMSLLAVGASGVFYIDGSSGKIKILRDLDRESIDKYILNVTVSDGTFTVS